MEADDSITFQANGLRKSILSLRIILAALTIIAGCASVILGVLAIVNETVAKSIAGNSVLLKLSVLVYVIPAAAMIVMIRRQEERLVEATSTLLRRTRSLNGAFSFYGLRPQYTYRIDCGSKREFDCRDGRAAVFLVAEEQRSFIESAVNKARSNEAQYKVYLEKLSEFSYPTDDRTIQQSGLSKRFYRRKEDELYHELLPNPVIKPDFRITVTYTSPQGRNHYEKAYLASGDTMMNCYRDIDASTVYEASVRAERAKMSDSLRYDIMRRDGFRCQICGSTAADGVKLHVDHIRPVSKGGKTEPSNLRTLCDRCNLGKSDRYDPNGIN